MRKILQETTNVKKGKNIKIQKTDKQTVLDYMKEVFNTTRDYSLKYDLSKCIEIIEGKENQEVIELKSALEEIALENERLIEEKTLLYMEVEELKTNGHRNKTQ